MTEVFCPYCDETQDVNHDDGYGYEEGETYQQECADCGKTFTYTTSIIYFHEAYQADCLNGGEHDYKLTHTTPKECSRMRCSICDDERQLTPEEKSELLTGMVQNS